MSIVKQNLFISKPKNAKQLEQFLSTQCQLSMQNPSCKLSDIYKCEEDINEFLLYEEWQDENSYKAFQSSTEYKNIDEKIKTVMVRKEFLRFD